MFQLLDGFEDCLCARMSTRWTAALRLDGCRPMGLEESACGGSSDQPSVFFFDETLGAERPRSAQVDLLKADIRLTQDEPKKIFLGSRKLSRTPSFAASGVRLGRSIAAGLCRLYPPSLNMNKPTRPVVESPARLRRPAGVLVPK